MALEFDSEVALLQNAFKSVASKYGDISKLEGQKFQEFFDVINHVYEDILAIRIDDGITVQQIEYRNRKLLSGLLCSVLRDSLDFWDPSECFEAIDDIYPKIGWICFLEIVKAFHWSTYLHEFLSTVHPDTLASVIQEILIYLLNSEDNANIPILVSILTLVIQPRKIYQSTYNEETSVVVNNPEGVLVVKYEEYVKIISEFLVRQLPNHKSWNNGILCNYYVYLFTNLVDLCCALLDDDSILMNSKSQYRSFPTTLTTNNLKEMHHNFCGKKDNEFVSNPNYPTSNYPSLVKYFELCYESLLVLDCREINQIIASSGKKALEFSTFGQISDLRICFKNLNELSKKVFICYSTQNEKFIHVLQLIQQRVENICQNLSYRSPNPSENVIGVIDGRNKKYEECLSHLINSPSLLGQEEYLECLKRNSDLLTKKQVHELMRKIVSEDEIQPMTVEFIQETILCAFSSWPMALQQQFHHECLSYYKDGYVLLTRHFEEELTMTFNKLINADVKSNKSLSLQMARLCLQSTRKTIAQSIFQAMNSKAQGNVLIQLLRSVSWCCRYKQSPSEPTILCEVLNDVLLNYCLTEMQFQNLKTFINKLLKTGLNSPQFAMPLITCAELMHTCILPYLDKWNPGHGCRLTLFTIQLLQMIFSFDLSSHTCSWLEPFKPCVLLCYLGLIIGQCKAVHRQNSDEVDWVFMKLQAVTTINKLTSVIAQCPSLVKKTEMNWLCHKLQLVDDSLTYYFVDLCDHFRIQLNISPTGNVMESLLEFSCCNDGNAVIAMPWFGRLVSSLHNKAEDQLNNALNTVLPFCLPDEWKRITSLLEYILINRCFSFSWKSCVTISCSEGILLCKLASLLLNVIHSCNESKYNVQYMIQCFSAIVKDKLNALREYGDVSDVELSTINVELFIQICHVMKSLPRKPSDEGSVLLMELSQTRPKKTINGTKLMSAAAENVHVAVRSNLLKVLSQE